MERRWSNWTRLNKTAVSVGAETAELESTRTHDAISSIGAFISVDAYIPVEFSTSLNNSQISTETEVAMGSLSNYDIFHPRYYSGVTYAGDFENARN